MVNRSLGRGLGSLIPQTPISQPEEEINLIQDDIKPTNEEGTLQRVLTTRITPNPYQPRLDFKHEELEQLAESIKKYGILAPLLVSKKGEDYQLIAGERRWQAATLIGLEKVPVIVRATTDLEKLELALLENLQRENLNAIEEALAYKRFIDEFNMTQEQVADRVDKNRSSIANSIRLLNLPKEIQEAIRLGTISKGQAKIILSVEDPKYQMKLFKKIIREGMTVRETRRATARYKKTAPIGASNIELSADEERLRNYLDTRIKIETDENGGRLVIEYYSIEELKRIIGKIVE
ncbi:ParB/RepB/Spo0J family partition protein [Patescibacteria group bacterium]|nr:ParB/RepB/Spo0J family partition protein [Patescibacteria group bacterium]